MTVVEESPRLSFFGEFKRDFPGVWTSIPNKGLFTILLWIWCGLFEFLGNSTFGYINSHSLFAWASYAWLMGEDDKHGFLIPFLVAGLLWWQRDKFKGLQTRPWLPGLLLIAFALILHIGGYLAQQTRVSLAAFFFGIYALMGVVWGPATLRAAFFPMCLFTFALPLGTLAETITFPLRLLAVATTGTIASHVFGISVIYRGTLLLDANGSFQFDVAAACGGLRSLTAVLALCTMYAFLNFSRVRNRVIMIAAGFPLAILGNITRLLMIVVVSEAFGQKAGQAVHDSPWLSLMPYLPPIAGITVLGHLLRERKPSQKVESPEPPVFDGKAQLPAAL